MATLVFRADDLLRSGFCLYEWLAKIVADALSRKSSHTLAILSGVEELNRDFAKLNLEVIREGVLQYCLGALALQPLFFEENLSLQDMDP